MELTELQKNISKKTCPKVLIFLGEDYALSNLYINSIAKKLSMNKIIYDSLQDVLTDSRGNSLFEENKLFIIKYVKDFISKEELWEGLEEKLNNNMLIIVFNEIDKRTKFYNKFKDRVVNFSPQDEGVFKSMVKEDTKLSNDNILELGKICKYNYGKSLLELDKIKCFSAEKSISEDASFNLLLNSGVIYTGNRDVIFEFIEKVLDADINMYKYYKILKAQGESNIKLISFLYTAFRNQFIVQSVANPMPESTGLNQYTVNMCLRRKGRYKNSDLRKALRLLCEIEQGIKSGKIDEPSSIDYFLVRLLL